MADRLAEDLVIAVLAVNKFPLEKAYALREGLLGQGLFDLSALAKSDATQVAERLHRAGYTRGPFMEALLADRLVQLARALTPQLREGISRCLERGGRQELHRILLPLKGVGPDVVDQFLLLAQSGGESSGIGQE